VVASLAALPHEDQLDSLLSAGGELTWMAGPLRKAANLCHGTSGNGFALMKLLTSTGDEIWLPRAGADTAAVATRSGRAILATLSISTMRRRHVRNADPSTPFDQSTRSTATRSGPTTTRWPAI